MNNTSVSRVFVVTIAFYFLYLAYHIFGCNYVMMDTVWTLWHQPEKHVLINSRASEGRVFYGYSQEFFFGLAGKISNIRYLRALSWAGWIACIGLFYAILNRIERKGELSSGNWTIRLTIAFTAASLPVILYIGWASCGDRFIPALLSMTAGLLLFEKTIKRGWGGPALALPVALGIVALFFYQTCYPFLLLPFYCLYLNRKDGKLTKPMLVGLSCYFLGLALYYLLFRSSLHYMGITSGERTALRFDPLDRLSFFFSYPMNQAFHLNFFFDTKSVLSQAIFPVLFAGWLLFEFFYRKGKALVKLRYVVGLIGWWVLGYLPQLVAQESFGAYRTMPVLGVMILLMVADNLLPLVKEGRRKDLLGLALVALFLIRGGYVYYTYMVRPFSEEYRTVKTAVSSRYNAQIKNVVFVLADEDGFLPGLGIRHQKDEFAMPSTYKGWTPEPLVKQIVYELTGNRHEAEMLKVSVYRNASEIPDRSILGRSDVMFIDAHTLF
jgi:hypothetical protein